MAQSAQVYVAGMREILREVRKAGPELQRQVRDQFRAEVAPTVSDIRNRFRSLGRMPGRRTAETVRGSFSQNRIELVMGGRGGPKWGFEAGVEFGAKGPKTATFQQRRPSGTVTVTRTVDYSKTFGPWTGNQWQPQGPVSGRAFYPGIQDHHQELTEKLVDVVERAFDKVAKAGV